MVDETVATNVKYKDDEQRRAFRAVIAKKGITAQDLWQQAVKVMIKTGMAVDDLGAAMNNGAVEIQKLYKMIGCNTCRVVDACPVDLESHCSCYVEEDDEDV